MDNEEGGGRRRSKCGDRVGHDNEEGGEYEVAEEHEENEKEIEMDNGREGN